MERKIAGENPETTIHSFRLLGPLAHQLSEISGFAILSRPLKLGLCNMRPSHRLQIVAASRDFACDTTAFLPLPFSHMVISN